MPTLGTRFAKRARPLFALVAPLSLAACMSEAAAWPLRDGLGCPACGNIGQVGRPDPRPAPLTSPARLHVTAHRASAFPALELAATAGLAAGVTAAVVSVAVATWDDDVALPPQVSVSPPVVALAPTPTPEPVRPRRVPTTLVSVAPRVVTDAAAEEQDECKQRPLEDDSCRPACGNVMYGKGGCRRVR